MVKYCRNDDFKFYSIFSMDNAYEHRNVEISEVAQFSELRRGEFVFFQNEPWVVVSGDDDLEDQAIRSFDDRISILPYFKELDDNEIMVVCREELFPLPVLLFSRGDRVCLLNSEDKFEEWVVLSDPYETGNITPTEDDIISVMFPGIKDQQGNIHIQEIPRKYLMGAPEEVSVDEISLHEDINH